MSSFEETFNQAETEALKFLEGRGFRCVERQVIDDGTTGTAASVRYQATAGNRVPAGWSVSLSIAPYRLELALDVADADDGDYTIEELHRLEGEGPFPAREHSLSEAMTDPAALRREFERLAGVLRQAGGRFFAGDATLWQALGEQRDLGLRDAEDRRVIAESEQAFRSKDWAHVVQLLEPLNGRLHGVAVSRLAYARKRASAIR